MGLTMANRYIAQDQTRWTGPTHLGAGEHDPAKRIAKFIFDAPDGTPVAKLRTAYVNAVETVSALRAKRKETESSNLYTALGVAERLGEHAMTQNLPALRRARTAVERVKADIAERRSNLTITKPTDAQHRELAEIRSAMRA